VTSRLVPLILALALPAALAGCAAHVEEAPTDPATAIVRMRAGGGNEPLENRWRLPWVTIFGDGTVVLQADDEGGLFTGFRRTLTRAQIDELFVRAGDADLFADEDYDRDDIMDAGSISVRITSTTHSYRTSVYAPSDEDWGNRRRVAKFADWAATIGTEAGKYQPSRYAVLALNAFGKRSEARPWPLPVPLAEMPGAAAPCVVLDAAAAAPLVSEVRAAGDSTVWDGGPDRDVELFLRPMLPDETGCESLLR
jgi:hypothetical protein